MDNPYYRPIIVIIADDHELIREGFVTLLNKNKEISVVAEASNGEELIRLAHQLQPDIIITDIQMPVMNGIEVTRKLTIELPHIGIIALSMFEEQVPVLDMLEAGAKGYLLKNAGKQEIIDAIKAVFKDEPYYSENINNILMQIKSDDNRKPILKKGKPEFTDKEIEIIKFICNQYSNKEIGDQMRLSKRTIESYREQIRFKINAKNTVGIALYAIKNRIVR